LAASKKASWQYEYLLILYDLVFKNRHMDDLNHLNPPKSIREIDIDSRAAGFTMPSDPLTCSFLRILATSKSNGRFLELGSGTGLSTAWILDGMDRNSHLTTIDNDENLLFILRKHLGTDPRLTVVCGDGDEFLTSLYGQEFDFIFADTWSGKYQYLDEALALLKPSGIYAIDDMLPQPNWPEGHVDKVERLISTLEQRTDLRIIKMSWASGIIIAIKL
jgi:predicted O-methyltransferase YrrM